jgi:hypothetical protein
VNSWVCVLKSVALVSGLPSGRFDGAEAKKFFAYTNDEERELVPPAR